MCNPIHGIRLCTCEEVNEDGSVSYWQLYRNIGGEQIITEGIPMFGYYISINRAPMLRRIRKALDLGVAFDFGHVLNCIIDTFYNLYLELITLHHS